MDLRRKVFTFCKTLLFPDLSRIKKKKKKKKLTFKNLSFSLTGGGKMTFPKKTT